MPILPRVEPTQVQVGVPRGPRENVYSQFGQALGQLSEIVNDAQKQQAQLDFANSVGEYETRWGQAIQETKSEPDYMKRSDMLRKSMTDVQSDIFKKTSNPIARQSLQLHFAQEFPKRMLRFDAENQKEWGYAREAELTRQADVLSDAIIRSDNPHEVDNLKGLYDSMVRGAESGPAAYINQLKGEQMRRDFNMKTLSKRADKMTVNNAGGFLAAADHGDFNALPEDVLIKKREEARKRMADDEKRNEQLTNEVKKVVEEKWQAAANGGKLSDSDLKEALDGRHPFITPQKARELKNVNDNPPSGEGAQQIRAIVEEYHSGPSSFGRIGKYRDQLNALRSNMKAGNPLIDKALNELQTDERTMQGIDAQKVNRDIKAAEDAYDAGRPPLPFNSPIFTNKTKQDKAKIADTIRKGGDPKALIQSKGQENKAKVDGIPAPNKSVMELVR